MKDLQKLVGSLNKSGALSGFLGGVAGGGLTSLLGGKKSKKMGAKAVKYGALAAVGGLAWKAYQQYSEKSSSAQQAADKKAFDEAMQQRQGANRYQFEPATMQQQTFEHVVEDETGCGQLLLMRAMIAAAYADGHIDESERQKIFSQVEQMTLSMNEKAMLFDELRKPMSLSDLVASVPNAQTGIEVYAASASAIDLNQQISQQYLQTLANQLCLPRELVNNIHQQIAHSE
ncbi:tellurite resistance TerB family protein [Pseudoalteromonas sp. SSM20]|uniref:tellurite resistance TerB family protein n=1 Tax=Pseudoalteromonas sp. SSM20 TaxID=3139394 RepID=UPI003BA9331A